MDHNRIIVAVNTAGIQLDEGKRRWTLSDLVHNLPAKDRRIGLLARSGSIRCSIGPEPARVAGASVTFEPGARTAWHTHPLGADADRDGRLRAGAARGGPVEEIRPGDVVWFPPGEKHWHGATATTAMTHIAIQEKLDGKAVDWMEKVSDEQYRA